MSVTRQIAKQLRDVHFGGNWTGSCLKDKLDDLDWRRAAAPVQSFHSIAAIVFHMNYFIEATIQVLEGGPLDAKDKYSFDLAPIESMEDWQALLDKTWADAERLAVLIEEMPESQLWETFVDEKYGNYHRCLTGPVEHCHYHLGQISLIRKMLD